MKLQMDINMVSNWGADNDLGFDMKKCYFLVLTTTKVTQKPFYIISGEKLGTVQSIKDLSFFINYVIFLSI
jgi:hypothetical protein